MASLSCGFALTLFHKESDQTFVTQALITRDRRFDGLRGGKNELHT
jgi:hypothetical protein